MTDWERVEFWDDVLFSALCTRCYQLAAKYFREGGWKLTDRCRCPAPPVLPHGAELARHVARARRSSVRDPVKGAFVVRV